MTSELIWPSEAPPTDPVELRDWLLAKEEQVARLTRQRLTEVVDRAYGAFLSTLTASGDVTELDVIPVEFVTVVGEELVPLVTGLYIDGAISSWILAPGTDILSDEAFLGWQRVVNEEAVLYQQAATNRLVGVGDNVWKDVRSKTVTAIEQGWTNEELKDAIQSHRRFSEYRADTIARTEANAAYNGGNYSGAQALGEYGPVAKTWSAFIDRRTRDSHREANEQTVAFSDQFTVGGVQMDRPHDPSAPAGEVVNCRCRVLFLYDGDEDSTGKVWTSSRPQAGALNAALEPVPWSARSTRPQP